MESTNKRNYKNAGQRLHYGNTGVEWTPNKKKSAHKVDSGEEISPVASAGIRTRRNLSITRPALLPTSCPDSHASNYKGRKLQAMAHSLFDPFSAFSSCVHFFTVGSTAESRGSDHGHSHSHDHQHGHTHDIMDSPGTYTDRDKPLYRTDWKSVMATVVIQKSECTLPDRCRNMEVCKCMLSKAIWKPVFVCCQCSIDV